MTRVHNKNTEEADDGKPKKSPFFLLFFDVRFPLPYLMFPMNFFAALMLVVLDLALLPITIAWLLCLPPLLSTFVVRIFPTWQLCNMLDLIESSWENTLTRVKHDSALLSRGGESDVKLSHNRCVDDKWTTITLLPVQRIVP